MIIYCRDDDEYDSAVAAMEVVNTLRRTRMCMTPRIDDTPWIQTRMPHPQYL